MSDHEDKTTPKYFRYEGEYSQGHLERLNQTMIGERAGENKRKRREREEEREQTEGERSRSQDQNQENQEPRKHVAKWLRLYRKEKQQGEKQSSGDGEI